MQRPRFVERDDELNVAPGLRSLLRSMVLEAQHNSDPHDVAHGAAGQCVGQGEPRRVARLQPGVAHLELQPGRRLPVGRRRQAEPPGEQHQARGGYHYLSTSNSRYLRKTRK
uniref:Uncharacterized protein n=1 Tax=Ananas comosus var. bracteatus TaxID=296719 RepID=A0A6V7NLY5_ANACO|nr:unnamed protein product [Ananas comosus var. bracteatus]